MFKIFYVLKKYLKNEKDYMLLSFYALSYHFQEC